MSTGQPSNGPQKGTKTPRTRAKPKFRIGPAQLVIAGVLVLLVALGLLFPNSVGLVLAIFAIVLVAGVAVGAGVSVYNNYKPLIEDPEPAPEAFYSLYQDLRLDRLNKQGAWIEHFKDVDRARLDFVNAHRPDRVPGDPVIGSLAAGVLRLDALGVHWTPEKADAECGVKPLFMQWEEVSCTIEPLEHPVTFFPAPHIVLTFEDGDELIFLKEENEDVLAAVMHFGLRDA